MRISNIAAAVALCAALPLTTLAQDTGRVSPDSIRPQDTEPSIPVATPTIGPATSGERSGSAGTGPDTPVSSDARNDGAVAPLGGARSEPGQGSGVVPASDPAQTGVGAVEGREAAGGLPARTAPERTLRAHWHVYVAFTIVWALLFGYVVVLGRRFARLETELERLGG